MADLVCRNHQTMMDAFETGPRDKVLAEVNKCVINELFHLPEAETFKKQELMFKEIIKGIADLHGSACTAERRISEDPRNQMPYLDITCDESVPGS